MKSKVSIDGQSREVSCEHSGDGFVVRVEDREYVVRDVTRHGNTLTYFIGNALHTVRVSPASDGAWLSLGGGTYRLTEEKRDTDRPTAGTAPGDGKLEAPMPGNVVSVKVSEGERVAMGAPVVVLESMKMMNEISAPADGVVRRVHCAVGQHVGFGDMLVEIDADKVDE